MTRARKASANHKRPALIIDGGSRGDIGVIRSLGWGHVPIRLLVTDPSSPSTASRYVTHTHPFPGFKASDDAMLEAVKKAAREAGARPVMLATGDRALSFMSRNRCELADFVDMDLAPAELIETCLDKDRFAPVASRLGLPVPETHVPEDFCQARMIAERVKYPVFVKPVERAEWERLPRGAVESVKGQRFNSSAELLKLIDALEQVGAHRFVIQSFIEGGDHEHMSVHAYVLPDGTMAGTFTGSKLRVYPSHAGVGTHIASLHMPEPERLARETLRALNYTGFAILQFKRDARSGKFQLIEINCRYSTWTELPSRAGCNFPLAAYSAMVGDPLPLIRQREGIAWLDLERDLMGMSTYRASGEWTWGGYLKSLSSVRCWAYFAWDDPKPFFRKIINR
jgi:D-aspartate ligase